MVSNTSGPDVRVPNGPSWFRVLVARAHRSRWFSGLIRRSRRGNARTKTRSTLGGGDVRDRLPGERIE